mmetsp:Transcript_103979/g.291286  ORF Transcript_103979/g.291286 Transcript_103979/m.291286 type:complete len:236 (-) Transcript_103979:529-1236(-)
MAVPPVELLPAAVPAAGAPAVVQRHDARLHRAHDVERVAHLPIQVANDARRRHLLHGVVVVANVLGLLILVQEAPGALQDVLHLLDVFREALLLQALQVLLQVLAEEHVGQAPRTRDATRHDEGVQAEPPGQPSAAAGPEEEPATKEHVHPDLVEVNLNLCTVERVEATDDTTAAEEDRQDPPDRRAQVRHDPRDVRRAADRAKVHRAHAVLQATSGREEVLRDLTMPEAHGEED